MKAKKEDTMPDNLDPGALALLKELCLAHGAPSCEDEVRAVARRYLAPLGDLETDRLGSILCTMKNGAVDGPRVLVAGHMDEVAFAVQHITPEGFLRIVPLGSWWTHNLLSQRLSLRTRSGEKVLGVVTSTPPHLLDKDALAKVLPVEELYVDIGAPSRAYAEQELGVSLGDTLVPATEFTPMNNPDLYLSKAFDNRAGMAVAIQDAIELQEESLPCRLLIGGSVQEEVGLRGARTLARLANPDLVIVLEGPPADDTPGLEASASQGRLGGGAQIRLLDPSAISNRPLADHAVDVAKANSIPYQIAVRRTGATDAGSFHIANTGVPTVVIGVPARYIHTHNALLDIKDYAAAIQLVKALVRTLNADRAGRFLKHGD